MTFEEIYNVYIKDYKVGYETFVEVYNTLSNAYSVNPKLIRPSDSLKKFFDIDSWDLDAGTEKMEEWLVKNLKIATPKKEIKTVLDLLILVERDRNRK